MFYIMNCLSLSLSHIIFISVILEYDDKSRQREGTTFLLLHIVTYEVSPKSLLHLFSSFFFLVSFHVALFSPLVVRFFLPLTDYTLVGAAVSRDSQDTKTWNEREVRDDEERTECTDVRGPPVQDREIDLSNYVKQSPG